MNDLKDFRFDSKSQPDDFETGPIQRDNDTESSRGVWQIGAIVAVVVVAAVLLALWLRRPTPQAETPAAPAAEAPTAPADTATPEVDGPPLELPALDASDLFLRELVETLSAHPNLATWLASDDLVRRFTVSVVNIAEGATPKTHLADMAPPEPFSVAPSAGGPHPTDKSYARYDALTEAFTSLDPVPTMRLYFQLQPLFEEAFVELGYPGVTFHEKLVAALDHLLATPAVEGDVALEETVAAYRFADPELEALSAAQKQLLRTGPENARRIQNQLRALQRELLAADEG